MSQVTDIKNSKCLESNQIAEIYKGLKQGEYLKVRVQKTEGVLTEATLLIAEQKTAIAQSKEIINTKDVIIDNLNFQILKEKEIAEAEKEQLNNMLKAKDIVIKAEGKKKFWNGVKIGGISVGIAGVAAILLLNK